MRPFGCKIWQCAALLAATSPIAAQAQQGQTTAAADSQGVLRVAVLRTTQGDDAEASTAIDAALLRDLSGLAGIENPTVSPIDYAEIQLTVGCSDDGRECLASIAKMVQVDAVIVRKLSVTAEGATLSLLYFDASVADEPARADESAQGNVAGALLRDAVPTLVRRLFGIPEPVVAAPESEPGPMAEPGATQRGTPAEDSGGVGAFTWITLAAGTGVLTAGIVVAASATSSFEDYKKAPITSEDELERANSKLESANTKGLVASVFIPSGAVVLALGATLLVLDLTSDDPSEPNLALWPLRDGAMLSLRGKMGGL